MTIPGQTAIPPEQPPAGPVPCAWCGRPSTSTLLMQKARFTHKRGIKEPARLEKRLPVCAEHKQSIRVVGMEDES